MNETILKKITLGAQMMIMDWMIEDFGFDGNTKVDITQEPAFRALMMTVRESFASKRLKRYERRYVEIPENHWIYKHIPKKFKKKFIVEVTELLPHAINKNNPAIIYTERDTFTRK